MKSHYTVRAIGRAVAAVYGLTWADLEGVNRTRRYTQPRQLAIWLAARRTGRSTPFLGRVFGGRDHTTVVHALRVVEARRADRSYRLHVLRVWRTALKFLREERALMLRKKGKTLANGPRRAAQPKQPSPATMVAEVLKKRPQTRSMGQRGLVFEGVPPSGDEAVRAATRKLVELLRQHHPERETK